MDKLITETIPNSNTRSNYQKLLWLFSVFTLLLIILIIVFAASSPTQESAPEIITASALKKIINLNELSTYTAVYNGIANVKNEKKTDETDYYVSYEARVNAGIDFEAVDVSVDHEKKLILITIPNVILTDINVDISSLDFIFFNNKANTSSITQEAYKACIDDVKLESSKQEEIFKLAKQNAQNTLTALIRPFVEQLDVQYELIVE